MKQGTLDTEAMGLSDRLAVERTAMAAERTLLAWVRTALSSIAFGFTIYKVLGAMAQAEGIAVIREQTPRNIGVFMILIGVVPLLLATFQYRRDMRRMRPQERLWLSPGMASAAGILLLGAALLVVVLWNLSFL